jgi:cyclic peptide transporter
MTKNKFQKKGGSMKGRRISKFSICIIFPLLFYILSTYSLPLFANENPESGSVSFTEIEKKVQELMEEGDIPGLSLVIVNGEQPVYVKGFGYADIKKQEPVTPDTLFELCSTSKAFTALAILKLEREGLVNLDDPVSKYLEWFFVTYKGEKRKITLRQVLHQTSGIPFKSIARIPISDADNALEQTVRNLSGFELDNVPGAAFEYATINYDILGAVIEAVTRMSYEDYMTKHIFQPLGLTHTRVGTDKKDPLMSTGYRISFFSPREYDAPVYRGNNPAGYIVSNGKDMARWLQFQMGLLETNMQPLMEKSHQPDRSVMPNPMNMSSYAMGWFVYQFGSDLIEHPGGNPNYTSHIAFRPGEKKGVVVLANSNSVYTPHIANVALELVRGNPIPEEFTPGRTYDGIGSLVSLVLLIYLLLVAIYLGSIMIDGFKGNRQFEPVTWGKLLRLVVTFLLFVPFAFGVYLLPLAWGNIPWEVATVWTSNSFNAAAILMLAAMVGSYIASLFSSLFPMKNKYKKSIPLVIILSLLSGGANAVVIFLITSSLFSSIKLIYQVYFYALAFFIYILGRKIVQTRLTQLTFQIVYDLRMRLMEKICLTSYQRFEKLNRGRVFATLNDDTGQIANSANIFVGLITSIITAICAFIYLFTIAFWATALTLVMVVVIATLYGIVSGKARALFEDARDTRNVYMSLLNGLLDGFKELSLRHNKKKQYKDDVDETSDRFSKKMSYAIIRFINAFLIGESLLLVILGGVSFAIPRLFPDVTTFTLMSFIMILLYLIGPVNVILNSIPAIVQIRVSWNRVKEFEKDIPANIDPQEIRVIEPEKNEIERIVAKGIVFKYESEDEEEPFTIGPLDFEAKRGEITFIIGGNGSGKTTLAKLLTGLYLPEEGYIQIEGKEIEKKQLGEYFSTVFSGFHLFEKLYDVDVSKKEKVAENYIKLLHLQDKVEIKENSFSTIDLSGGQRKRLALLQCYLEDAPIYLFDEVAADQDPEFRKFFYRNLLMRMKEDGKIVIAITHDDHYFDVADRVIKMDMGKIETVDASYRTTAAQS